jgi:stress response protein YsnF
MLIFSGFGLLNWGVPQPDMASPLARCVMETGGIVFRHEFARPDQGGIMRAKPNPERPAAGGPPAQPSAGERAAESLSAHARRQAGLTADAPAAESPDRTGDVVTWREEVEIRTETGTTSATVTVRTYVAEEKVSRQIPLMREEASVTKEKITPAEAVGMVPREIRGDRKQTFEVELSMQEAVVSKRLVPSERVRVEVRRVTDMVSVDETVKAEHVEIEEPQSPKRLRVRRVGVTNLGAP